MNSLRHLSYIVLAIGLGTFALPSAQASPPKKSLSTRLQFAGGGTTGQYAQDATVLELVIKNLSNPTTGGTSNISSLQFALGNLKIVPGSVICPNATPCDVDSTNTVAVNNISPPIQPYDATNEYKITFKVMSCGDSTLASVRGWTSSQVFGGQEFSLVADANFTNANVGVACGRLACNRDLAHPTSFTVPTADSSLVSVTGFRGAFDKDGLCSTADDVLPYYVTNLLGNSSSSLLHFRWPLESGDDPSGLFDEAAAFQYTVAIASSDPKVAWLPPTGAPEFVNAPVCISDQLPAPYASLAASVSKNDKKIVVSLTPPTGTTFASIPSTLPFPIVMRNDNGDLERMDVTKIGTNNTWTVTRGAGGTTPVAFAASPAKLVMSTPLPILTANVTKDINGQFIALSQSQINAGYKFGVPAQVCIVGRTPAPGLIPTFIDIGDAYIKPAG